MNIKKIRLLAGMFFAVIILLSCNAVSSEPIRWYSYDEGMALAKDSGRKVFVYFYTNRCGYCSKMKSQTFSNSAVASYLNENFIAVKVNAAEQRQQSVEYNVRGDLVYCRKQGKDQKPARFFCAGPIARATQVCGY